MGFEPAFYFFFPVVIQGEMLVFYCQRAAQDQKDSAEADLYVRMHAPEDVCKLPQKVSWLQVVFPHSSSEGRFSGKHGFCQAGKTRCGQKVRCYTARRRNKLLNKHFISAFSSFAPKRHRQKNRWSHQQGICSVACRIRQ